jgi:N-sulfoglucosamine sulfohydrolase
MVDLTQDTTPYDYMRSGEVDLTALVDAAEYATNPNPDPQKLAAMLDSDDPALTYWGATGLLILGEKSRPVLANLKKLASDQEHNGAIVAAECLYLMGEKETGKQTLLRALKSENPFARGHALNVVDNVDDNSTEMRQAVVDMVKMVGEFKSHNYDLRMSKFLFAKWDIDPQSLGIDMNW